MCFCSVERIVARETRGIDLNHLDNGPDAHHPVIRTLYDHIDEVLCIVFHPREPILMSGAKDFTIKLFDYSKTAVKRAMKTIFEVGTHFIHKLTHLYISGRSNPCRRSRSIPLANMCSSARSTQPFDCTMSKRNSVTCRRCRPINIVLPWPLSIIQRAVDCS
jgi:WD40 repeat protein